jgi:hypothetical protein
MSGFSPTYRADSLHLWIGTWGAGRATASSTTLDLCVFPILPGATSAVQFTAADVGCPIAIVGAGPVDPLTPGIYGIPGSTFVTTIAAYVSPSHVTLTDAPPTSFYNSGVNNVAVYRKCVCVMDSIQFSSTIAPGTNDALQFATLDNPLQGYDYFVRNQVICKGQPVLLTSDDPDFADNTAVFGGLIDILNVSNQMSTSGSGPSGGSGLTAPANANLGYPFSFSAQCRSWDSIASRRIVQPERATKYTQMDAGVIMNLVVVTNLNDEGIAFENDVPPISTSPLVSGLPVIDFGVPAGSYIIDLLNQLVSQMNSADPTKVYFWYTDAWRTIHLSEQTVTAAPWDVDDTMGSAGNALLASSTAQSANQYSNQCYVVASEFLGNFTTVIFIGDGTTKSFNLPSAAVSAPSATIGITAQTVGVLNVDTGKQWYWSQGSSVFSQDAGDAPLGAGVQMSVAYQLSQPAVGVAVNAEGLAERAIVEGTGALYQSSTTFSQPIDQADLLNYCETLAAEFGTIPQQIPLSTIRPGLKVGQFQTIKLASTGISGVFLIASINMVTVQNIITWNYVAIGGANIGDQITAWAKFINRGQATLSLTTPTPPVYSAENTITIDHTKVVGGDKTDFIFGFIGVYEFLKTIAAGGGVNYSDGSDIFFSTTTDQTGLLDFDLGFYDGASGQIAAWVRIPTLSSTVDTVIYILYGSPSISVSLANPADTWSPYADVSGTPNPNYHGVYHLGESGAPYNDSTKYANASTGSAGSGYPTVTDGPFGLAQFFSAPSSPGEGIALPSLFDGFGFSNFNGTIECWINTTSVNFASADQVVFVTAAHTTSFGHGFAVTGHNDGVFGHQPGFGVGYLNYNGGVNNVQYNGIQINDGNWHRLTVTQSASDVKIYVDGVDGGSLGFGQNNAMGSAPVLLGSPFGVSVGQPYDGALAETRMTQIVKDANTIATEWANQSSPDTFYAITNSVISPPQPPVNVIGNPQGTVTHTTGGLTANMPVVGNGGADIKSGTRTGNTTELVSATGAATSGGPLIYDASGNAEAGAAGQLVPSGGTAGEVLTKNSGTNYDTIWQTPSDDIQVNGITTLNIIQINGVEVWRGQTEIQINGSFI